MNNRLAIDRGNSFTKVSIFDGQTIVAFESHTDEALPNRFKELQETFRPDAVIISDVRGDGFLNNLPLPFTASIVQMHPSLRFPFSIHYQTPESIGHDRLANIAGAALLYPGSNTLVIDCGSCITFSLLYEGAFIGGTIAPGIRMRYRALHDFTGKLPALEPCQTAPSLVGSSTIACLQSGVELAILLETDAFIQAYHERFNNLRIIVTGGDYSFFENSLKSTIFAVPQLTQLGLHEILRINGG